MSVKIEILDYIYGEFVGNQMISNYDFNSSTDWTLGTGWSIASGSAIHSGSSGYLENTNVTFVEGLRYRMVYRIGNRTAGSLILANHLPSGANGFNQTNNGTFYYDWIQGSTNTTKLSLYGSNNFNGSVGYVAVYPISNIDWDKSVVGELDVTSHEDFPLAFTFSVSDVKKLDSRSGTYSKTFKIPATKHNNKLLKNIYRVNSSIDNEILSKKKCRISINGIQTLDGLLKITAVGGYDDIAAYYSCVFFGNNLSWAKEIGDKYMSDIDWGSDNEGLKLDKTNISNTWAYSDCNSANESIVYPLASYGKVNSDGGEIGAVQLLETAHENNGSGSARVGYYGFYNTVGAYPTPEPELDWRPMIWVKDVIDKIFENSGYNIVSTFMDTDMFKRLLFALPNAKYNEIASKERYDNNSFKCNFNNYSYTYNFDVCGQSADESRTEDIFCSAYNGNIDENDHNTYYNGSGRYSVQLDTTNTNTILDQNGMIDFPSDIITIREYGFYDITLKGLAAKVAYVYKGGGTNVTVDDIWTSINIDVQTVGQTSWNVIETSSKKFPIGSYVDSACSRETDWANMSDISTTRWFNIGDKIRLTKGIKLTSASDTQNFTLRTLIRGNSNNSFYLELKSELMEYGQTYNLSDIIDPEWKQMDFLKGIIHAFNLQMTTDNTTGEIMIEPYKFFYDPYKFALDWNGKLDRGSEITSKWISNSLKRNVVFKYKTDSKDAKIKPMADLWWRKIQDYYPYFEDLGNQIEQGESKFENPFFAGTYTTRDADLITPAGVPKMFTSAMWESNWASTSKTSRGEKGNDFLPRLLYWNTSLSGLTSFVYPGGGAGIPIPAYAFFSVQNWDSATWYWDYIPQATSIDRHNIDSPNLCYGNAFVSHYDISTSLYEPAVSHKGLYETYYKSQFEAIKSNPRLITAYFDLKVSDIINLDFRKLIYFNEVYYKINKIIDYAPLKNTPTKVELIEHIFTGEFQAGQVWGGSSSSVGAIGIGGEDVGVGIPDDEGNFG